MKILVPLVLFVVGGYTAYLNGRIRQMEKDIKRLEITAAVSSSELKSVVDGINEMKADIKRLLKERHDI